MQLWSHLTNQKAFGFVVLEIRNWRAGGWSTSCRWMSDNPIITHFTTTTHHLSRINHYNTKQHQHNIWNAKCVLVKQEHKECWCWTTSTWRRIRRSWRCVGGTLTPTSVIISYRQWWWVWGIAIIIDNNNYSSHSSSSSSTNSTSRNGFVFPVRSYRLWWLSSANCCYYIRYLTTSKYGLPHPQLWFCFGLYSCHVSPGHVLWAFIGGMDISEQSWQF